MYEHCGHCSGKILFLCSAELRDARLVDKSPANADKFDAQLLNLKGRINPYWKLAKWFIGQSNHTFIAILTALTENAGVKYGSSKHQHLVNEKKELLKEFETVLGTTGVFLYPTHPTVAPYHNEPIVRALNFSDTLQMNAQQLHMTGVVVLIRDFCVVVVEGGPKQQKKYKRLMQTRIKWEEDMVKNADGNEVPNSWTLVWEGTAQRRHFGEVQSFLYGENGSRIFPKTSNYAGTMSVGVSDMYNSEKIKRTR